MSFRDYSVVPWRETQYGPEISVLILTAATLNFTRDGKPNLHAFQDVGLAVDNLIVQVTPVGLSVHQLAGFDVETARELFELPNGYEPVAGIAVGYAVQRKCCQKGCVERQRSPALADPRGDCIRLSMG
jgi:nitroreductase